MRFSDLVGRRVAVWGQGREGTSVTEYVRGLGVEVVVAEPDLPRGDSPGVVYGADGSTALLTADVVIKSPGVPVTHDLHRALVEAGVAITSLTDLWLSDNAHRVVAITGTKGKSTTASLLHHLLLRTGVRSSLRGNIGTSVLAESDPPAQVVVMELSSYQAQSLTRSPRIVAVTSLFPEHLTWHGSLESYYSDKLNAVAHGPETVVVPAEADEVIRRVSERLSPGTRLLLTDEDGVHVAPDGAIVWPDGPRIEAGDLPLPGRHHAHNIALALRLAGLLGPPPEALVEALSSFAPLPHRMEPVPSDDGRTWLDDSLATAPEAVVASLSSLAPQPDRCIAVIVGGEDRGLTYDVLLETVSAREDVELLLVGPTGARLAPACEASGLRARLFTSFGACVAWARARENRADIVLLSPGAPSYDEFANFEERSAAFRAAALGTDSPPAES
ncbi:UDP-N-acetylmuramoyl-L-alanine--D-glutamate ligase [Nocardioides gilvus]|uniref:UDP-N-acetylmuramoyl-L-alanine--D-glutamate ligase n=1 Tax=Nocardioides gilvus TaxID=1735589 RepID=UPI0013A55FA2|nr:UDP-N-acetylmuramoyl-L-alanine--D-glutamate ligase [Nocardioides gilvus]